MTIVAVRERELQIADDVRAAVSLLKTRYQAVLTHDSGHTDTGPTWIFTVPKPRGAQVAVRMNKRDLSLYLRDKTWDGKTLEPLLAGLAEIKDRYPEPGKNPSHSLLRQEDAPYLRPSNSNRLLLIRPRPEALERILDLYLSHSPESLPADADADADADAVELAPLPDTEKRMATRKGAISADELLAQLDRNAATGRVGEAIVFADELSRLQALGCPDPKRYVELVAQIDVGRGYDIASLWPGEERCIEVKTTTASGSDFFITENEQQVLAEMGQKAWLYRVDLLADGSGTIVARIQDPVRMIPDEAMRPVVWRVNMAGLT